MYVLISFAMAVAPALYLVRYFYKKDINRPEPKGLIVKIFLLGVASTIVALVLELLVARLGGRFIRSELTMHLFRAFVVAGFCEEYIKLRVVKRFAYNQPAFDEVMDGIVYTVVASLGFACLENILYVLGSGISTALLRAFTAVPMHAFMSGIMGYFIGRAKFARTKTRERLLLAAGLLIAVALHGAYDFLLFAAPTRGMHLALGILPLLVAAFIVLKLLIRSATAEDARAGRA